MKIFEASISRLLNSDANSLLNEKAEIPLIDVGGTSITNITLQNDFSLSDISNGFECENLRYKRSLEL